MPSYQITPRNSFQVQGLQFFVARTRYMDDGQQVFECANGIATPFSGFWGCLLLPDHQRKLPCREVARRMVTAWLKCKEWRPTKEQVDELEKAGISRNWAFDDVSYLRCYRHFHPENPQPEPTCSASS
jgi:hypothetical protein